MNRDEEIEEVRALLSRWAHVDRKDGMHEGCARLLAIVDELKRERDTERARAEAAESDATHVRAINATLLESMAAETKRADAAERALAEAREKVKALPRYRVTFSALGSAVRFETCLNGGVVSHSEVLAALGVES